MSKMRIVSTSADGNSKAVTRHSFQKDLMVFPNYSLSTLETKIMRKLGVLFCLIVVELYTGINLRLSLIFFKRVV